MTTTHTPTPHTDEIRAWLRIEYGAFDISEDEADWFRDGVKYASASSPSYDALTARIAELEAALRDCVDAATFAQCDLDTAKGEQVLRAAEAARAALAKGAK